MPLWKLTEPYFEGAGKFSIVTDGGEWFEFSVDGRGIFEAPAGTPLLTAVADPYPKPSRLRSMLPRLHWRTSGLLEYQRMAARELHT